mgnify:CR=1 FL=1
MNYQMNWRGPERLGDLKSSWYQAVPELGTPRYTQEVNRIFKEGSGGISAEQVQSLFILKALAGTEKNRAHIRMNKLWEEGKIDLDESDRMRIEESNIPYPILSYEQLRSKIPAKVRTIKKQDSVMKTEEELIAEGYTLAFVDPDGRVQLTSSSSGRTRPITPAGMRFTWPTWSPDGNFLTVSRYSAGENGHGGFRICLTEMRAVRPGMHAFVTMSSDCMAKATENRFNFHPWTHSLLVTRGVFVQHTSEAPLLL